MLTLAQQVGKFLQHNKLMLATAESCTGGLIAAEITTVAGSSAWFERGFVTYSNLAKQEMLGVRIEILTQHGAVSQQTVLEMAEGALGHSQANCSIAVTGIAGPDGGSDAKPVGTVWFAWAQKDCETKTELRQFQGDRTAIRMQATIFALEELLHYLTANNF